MCMLIFWGKFLKAPDRESRGGCHEKASFGLSDQDISREDHEIAGISYPIEREIV